MDQALDIPLEGELNCWSGGFDLPDLLLVVCKTGKTGLLRFVSAEAEKTLFLRDGKIIFAKSSSEDDRLGEYLLREGKISLQELEKCTHLVKPGKRLGTLLVEKGLLGPKELVQAVIGQVRAIVVSLFRWTEAWYGFDEQELPSKETITLDMPTSQLILDGVKLIESWRRITQGLGDMSSVYQRVPGNEEVLRDLELDAATREVLTHLSRPRSVAEACADSGLGDLEVCRMMWVFRSFGWIEEVDGAETSFEIVEGEVLELPEADETGAASTPMEATPVMLGTVDEAARPQIPELSPVDPPVSASLADINEPSIAAPQPMVIEPEIDMGDPFASTESETVIDLGVSSNSPESDPEIDLGNPPSPREPHSEESEKPSAPLLEADGGKPSPDINKSVKEEPVVEADDMDLEGLGMVFGSDSKE